MLTKKSNQINQRYATHLLSIIIAIIIKTEHLTRHICEFNENGKIEELVYSYKNHDLSFMNVILML